MLRLQAAAGFAPKIQSQAAGVDLEAFLENTGLAFSHLAVIAGTPGPAQKTTVALWQGERLLGFLKVGQLPKARERIAAEAEVLQKLPKGLGPKPVKLGALADALALAVTPLPGRQVKAVLPVPPEVLALARRMEASAKESFAVETHPWVQTLHKANPDLVDPWLEPLAGKDWPVIVSHGDFAPWNLFFHLEKVTAIDWEYGTLTGFPFNDVIFYILQVAHLIYGWPAPRAFAYAANFLRTTYGKDLNPEQINSLIRLSAFDAFHRFARDGQSPDTPLQAWRREVFECKVVVKR